MYWHETRIRVRFNEVDQWGVVWYGNYFSYVDVARCEVLEKVGLLPDALYAMGFTAPVINLTSTFKSPARFNDSLVVKISLVPQKTAKMVFSFQIVHEDSDTLVMRGESTQVLLNEKGFMVYKLDGVIAAKMRELEIIFQPQGDHGTG